MWVSDEIRYKYRRVKIFQIWTRFEFIFNKKKELEFEGRNNDNLVLLKMINVLRSLELIYQNRRRFDFRNNIPPEVLTINDLVVFVTLKSIVENLPDSKIFYLFKEFNDLYGFYVNLNS